MIARKSFLEHRLKFRWGPSEKNQSTNPDSASKMLVRSNQVSLSGTGTSFIWSKTSRAGRYGAIERSCKWWRKNVAGAARESVKTLLAILGIHAAAKGTRDELSGNIVATIIVLLLVVLALAFLTNGVLKWISKRKTIPAASVHTNGLNQSTENAKSNDHR